MRRPAAPGLVGMLCLGLMATGLFGCPREAAEHPVVYSAHIAPIVLDKCAGCHRPDQSAPFSLQTYDDVADRAEQIKEVVSDRYMPPWPPKRGFGTFIDDRSLSDDEVAAIVAWVDDGAPEGDPDETPAPPVWSTGWRLGEPDLVLTVDEAYELRASGPDLFRNFVIPTGLDRPVWVKAVEFEPDNARVVHHALVLLDDTGYARYRDRRDPGPGFEGMESAASNPDGQFLPWVPGKQFMGDTRHPWKLRPTADIVLQLHLQSSGKVETARPSIALYFGDAPGAQRTAVMAVESKHVVIPAGTSTHTITRSIPVPEDAQILGVWPHAHYLGKSLQGWATDPQGQRHWLFNIPAYDFNWQDEYRYRQPVRLVRGSTLTITYVYDNSADNVQNPNTPPRSVLYGQASTDEMAFVTFSVLVDSEETKRKLLLQHVADRAERDIMDLRKLLLIAPERIDYQVELASALTRIGGLDEAVGLYRGVVKSDPGHFGARMMLSAVLRQRGRLDEAIVELRSAVKGGVDSAVVYNNLGACLLEQGKLQEAEQHLRRALTDWPGYADAHYNLANLYARTKRPESAAEHYVKAIEGRPEFADAHNNLGILYMNAGATDRAIHHFQRAVRLNPGHGSAVRNLRRARGRRPQLGLRISPEAGGLRVTQVFDASPAMQAGLRVGDVIQRLSDAAASEAVLKPALSRAWLLAEPVKMTIVRDARVQTIELRWPRR